MSSVQFGAFFLFNKFPYKSLGRIFIKNLRSFQKCTQLSMPLQICTYKITHVKKIPKILYCHCSCFLSIWFIFVILHPKANSVNLVKVMTMTLLLFCALCFSDGLFPSLSVVLTWAFLSSQCHTLGSKTIIGLRLTQMSGLFRRELPLVH